MHRSHRFTAAVLAIATGLALTTAGASARPDRSGDGRFDLDRGPSTPPIAADSPDAHGLQQFTAGGHVLGFGPDGYHVSNGSYALRVDFVGANRVSPRGDNAGASRQTGGGGDKQAAAPALTEVAYTDLWDSIRLTYDAPGYGIARSTWHVAPGADPGAIRLRYNRPVSLNRDGSLAIAFDRGTLAETAPIAWQDVDGHREPVDVRFDLRGPREAGFAVGAYDPARELVIDPTLVWNTFLGSSDNDLGDGIAVDGSGYVYVVGRSMATWGSPVRAHSGLNDAYAAKLEPDGDLVWNTFLGGSGTDRAWGVDVDGSGNVYVAGRSSSTWGSPVQGYAGGSSDGFVAKLESDGDLAWSTFAGGAGTDEAWDVAVDGSGYALVVGDSTATWGSPVRAYTGGSDATVLKIEPDGDLVWNTFLGGSASDLGDGGVEVDGNGNVNVSGYSTGTWGGPVRAYTGGRDHFVAQLESDGDLVWNTFLGGGGDDNSGDLALGGSGYVYAAGYGGDWGSPVRAHSGGSDGFAAKLESDGDLVWNTFLGQSGADNGEGIGVDGDGNVYVAGYSNASWGSPWRSYSSNNDAYLAKVGPDGDLTWTAFLGGSGIDEAEGLAWGSGGTVNVVGRSDTTWDSPVRGYSGDFDAFVARIDDPPPPTSTSTISPTASNTPTPSHTPTASNTPTPTNTTTYTATPTDTPTATHTPSSTATPTPTLTLTAQPTWTPWIITATPVPTDTPTHTATPTHTPTPTTPLVSRGDCNADAAVNAADISGLVLELFDGDGSDPAAVSGGTFAGDGRGCNANGDAVVDAGDLACAVNLIFSTPGGCGP